ncbi:MAG: DUF5309 domain-containing protein [Gammaproteobacteria bacterium]|nr:DUF5309 domain-containing protein [Gammaproteobacteria bacterium]
MAGFLGMRGTGDWATDERPLNWRQGILYLYPNGMAPLTAILSKMGEEKVDDPQFHWWTKTLASQGGAVSSIYLEATLTTEYTTALSSGATVYAKVAEAVADEFRVGHQVLLRDASHLDVDVNAKVTAVVKNGASSYISCKLLEDDDNGASTDLSECDTILIVGNINAEGAPIPDSIAYNPTKHYNYTQIFRNPLELTRTAMRTKLRTADSYKEAKRESLELHSIEMEKAFLYGIATEGTGSNGKPERTTGGVVAFIKADASGNVNDFSLNSSYSGQTWLQGGEDWLDYYLEVIFRYGAQDKLAFVGSGALLGIQKLAKTYGNIQLSPTSTDYGIKVVQWITPFGTINLKTHPLFSFYATTRNAMLILEPSMLKYRYIDDTMFKKDPAMKEAGFTAYDGTKEEWLTECGLELHHAEKFGYLTGFNTDNAV